MIIENSKLNLIIKECENRNYWRGFTQGLFWAFLAIACLFFLTSCTSTQETRTVNCTEQQSIIDGALKAWMIANGYMFEGGC